jgi:protein phosphatase
MVITLLDPSLVLLIGPSGSGKSTFGRRHFRTTEVLSSDFCRALVCDNESDQTVTDDAFELLQLILKKRLQRRRTTVVDATNVKASSRTSLAAAAKQWNIPLAAIAFTLPEEVCQSRNLQRTYRRVPPHVIQQQLAELAASINLLDSEGFHAIFKIRTAEEAETVSVIRQAHYS